MSALWSVMLGGQFKPYDQDVIDRIESAYQAGNTEVLVSVRGTNYIIALKPASAMKQLRSHEGSQGPAHHGDTTIRCTSSNSSASTTSATTTSATTTSATTTGATTTSATSASATTSAGSASATFEAQDTR